MGNILFIFGLIFAWWAIRNYADFKERIRMRKREERPISRRFKLMKMNAKMGEPEAQAKLGLMYLNGEGTEKDLAHADAWLKKSAENGHRLGQLYMGYKNHKNGAYDLAFKWIKKAADQGNAEAVEMLGNYYAFGQGVDRDLENAVEHYRAAAEAGRPSAKRLYAQCLLLGQGVEQDIETGTLELEAASQLGDKIAAGILSIGIDVFMETSDGKASPFMAEAHVIELASKEFEDQSIMQTGDLGDAGAEPPESPISPVPESDLSKRAVPAPEDLPIDDGPHYSIEEEDDAVPDNIVTMEAEDDAPPLSKPEEKEDLLSPVTSSDKENVGLQVTLAKLDNLIGLEGVKTSVHGFINRMQLHQLRKKHQMPITPFSAHLVFVGNPGTGKTTVARILGDLFREIGFLEKGHVVEVMRADLVGEYVGQTAPRVKKQVKKALDGILFIDEAYSLLDPAEGQKSYGAEAVSTLLKLMEDYRDRLVVVVAGYKDEMQDFVNSNPGLRSRFTRTIEFEDFTAYQLFEIYQQLVDKYGYAMAEDASEPLKTLITYAMNKQDAHFGNARFIRNVFDDTITNLANRVSEIDNPGRADLTFIKKTDIHLIHKSKTGTDKDEDGRVDLDKSFK